MQATRANPVVDPVCGMTVDPATAAGSFEYKGDTYYFCSQHCLEKFRRTPEDFLKQPPTGMGSQIVGIQRQRSKPEASQTPASASLELDSENESTRKTYTCPMHSEVRQAATGSCPKCGMALEPSLPFQPTEKTEYTCPMHPEIVRDRPGSCPICGMALEPRVISIDDAENPELTEMRRRFWISAALTIPVFAIGMSDLLPGAPLQRLLPATSWSWIQFLLATPVVL